MLDALNDGSIAILSATMTHPLASARYCVTHAKRHIETFQAESQAFMDSQPCAYVVEFDPAGPDDIYKIKFVRPMPEALPGVAFDVIVNLRAALDQAGYAAAVAAGTKGKQAQFPFGETLADVESLRTRGSRNVPKDIFDVMVAAQPYKGGNGFLWAMNKLCNAHKHEIVAPVSACVGVHEASNMAFEYVKRFDFPPRWDSAKNEMVVVVMSHGAKFEMDLEITSFIAFSKIEGVSGQPAIGIMRKLAHEIDGILDAIDAQARRSGLFPA